METNSEDKKLIFALDIGTRSVVGIVGTLKDGEFTVLDYEQEFHSKRTMRDGQIEDIDLVASVVTKVKQALEQRSGQLFGKVSIAAAGRALSTAEASFTTELLRNEEINKDLVRYMEYSAIEAAQKSFNDSKELLEEETNIKEYYCVGYSVKDYFLDGYNIKNLVGQKGEKARVDIIAAFLPASVLIGLYAVTSRCGLEVDNLTLEPIAAIHAVVPEDVRFLNIALVDIGGGTSDIAISRDGSIAAYDMVTIAGDEVTEALMKHYLTNFATAEKIKLALGKEENIEFKDILGNMVSISPEEAFEAAKPAVNELADAISQRILHINGSVPAAVFLVGGGSQIKGLTGMVAEKLGMGDKRVAMGVVSNDGSFAMFNEELSNPSFVTPIGIGIVSSMYRGCDFFSIMVNDRRIMLFSHESIKVIDALVLAGIKPSSLIGLSSPNLVFTINGERRVIKGKPSIPGSITVNGAPATIETPISQGDRIKTVAAQNGEAPEVSLFEVLKGISAEDISDIEINGRKLNDFDEESMKKCRVNFMDELKVVIRQETFADIEDALSPKSGADRLEKTEKIEDGAEEDSDDDKVEINKLHSGEVAEKSRPKVEMDVELNGKPVHVVQDKEEEPIIVMHLLRYSDIDTGKPDGFLVIQVNGVDAGYSTPIADGDKVVIKWSGERS